MNSFFAGWTGNENFNLSPAATLILLFFVLLFYASIIFAALFVIKAIHSGRKRNELLKTHGAKKTSIANQRKNYLTGCLVDGVIVGAAVLFLVDKYGNRITDLQSDRVFTHGFIIAVAGWFLYRIASRLIFNRTPGDLIINRPVRGRVLINDLIKDFAIAAILPVLMLIINPYQ